MTAGAAGNGNRTVVFLGPTMMVEDAAACLDAVFLPPAAQGSLVCAVAMLRPARVILIDGVFEGEPAVRHKEILWALSRGVEVYGASSMGALRAAELAGYGMVGVGLIFRWYRRFQCLPDDAVAVLHAPPELGSRPLTISLIDLRLTIRAAFRARRIDSGLRRALESAARELNFRERTLKAVVARAAARLAPGRRRREALVDLLGEHLVEQKRADAIQVLEQVKLLSRKPRSAAREGVFVMTQAFRRDIEDAGLIELLSRSSAGDAGAPDEKGTPRW